MDLPSSSRSDTTHPCSHKNDKTKREPEEEEEGQSKKVKYSVTVISSSSEAADTTPAATLTSTSTASRKKSHKDDHKTSKKVASPASPNVGTSSGSGSDGSVHRDRKYEFNSKYEEEWKLGEGSFGAVYAARRVADNSPVAIKYIQQVDVERTTVWEDGQVKSIPLEVRLLQKLQSVPGVIRLLDWYDFPDQLILVLERPDPCEDLLEFVNDNNGSLQECDAKIIMEQLVDALIQIHAHSVFHRDIKLQNLLIETGSSIPRVRVIDFGCGTFMRKSDYIGGTGTYQYRSPEWLLTSKYKAEPVSVWQVGMTLFGLLHGSYPSISSVIDSSIQSLVHFNSELSRDCRDFLNSCFRRNPIERATLQTLQQHPWLTSRTPQPTGSH